jgi:hypothetical protein
LETRPHYTIISKESILLPNKKLVTLDRPEELFAALDEIQDAYAGYEVVYHYKLNQSYRNKRSKFH